MSGTDDSDNKYKTAYIRPVHDGGGKSSWATHDVTFIRNTENPSVYRWDSNSNLTPIFWVVYILNSFQDSYKNNRYDRDPNNEPGTGGSTDPQKGGSLIYMEQLRERYPTAIDKNDLQKRVVAHEVGHQLKLDHGEKDALGNDIDDPAINGIMNTNLQNAPTYQMRFYPRHLHKLRSLTEPKH